MRDASCSPSSLSPCHMCQDRPAPQRIDEPLRLEVCPEGDGGGQVAPPFGPVTAGLPVRPDRPGEPQRTIRVPALEQVLERRAQIRLLGVEALEPRPSLPRPQLRPCPLGELDVPGRVTVPERGRVRERVEPFGGELADRLEHPVALAGAAEQALVDAARRSRRRRRRRSPRPPRACSRRRIRPGGRRGPARPASSRSWLQAIVARSVRCRSGAEREPPASRGSRCSSRSSSAAGESTFTRAAASSIASGRQSRRRQISATSPFAAKSELNGQRRAARRARPLPARAAGRRRPPTRRRRAAARGS